MLSKKNLYEITKGIPKILLTATPLQNRLSDLHGLASFIDDRIFGPEKIFNRKFVESGDYSELKEQLSPILYRTLRKDVGKYMDFKKRTFDPNNVSIEVKARLNTAFNINTHGSENEKLPGKVYKTNQIDDLDSFDKSTFGKKGKQLVLTKKDKKVVVVYDLIKVDITPGCDYAQDKAFISTYAYGYLIHIYKFEDEKGNKEWLEWKYAGMISDAGGVYFTPYFLNGDELCMLLVNTKWIRFEKYEVNEDNYLFRLNDSLTSDIRKSASDNIARVGIPCV